MVAPQYTADTATLELWDLGIPKTTGVATLKVTTSSVYGGPQITPKASLSMTGVARDTPTKYRLGTNDFPLDLVLAGSRARRPYFFPPRTEGTDRQATPAVTEKLHEVAHAALDAFASDPEFPRWCVSAMLVHVEKVALPREESWRRASIASLELMNAMTPSPQRDEGIAKHQSRLIHADALIDEALEAYTAYAEAPLTIDQCRIALTLMKEKHTMADAITAARRI